MSGDDMIAAVALGVESALSRLGLVRAKDAPPASKPAAPKPASDELRAKRLASLEKARAVKKAKAQAKPVAVAEKPAKPEKVKKSRKKAAKPAAESVKRRDDEAVDTFGAIEIVDYTRKDGTPGVMLRPKGRSRGVAFARGDFALFCAFANTFRKGETMDPIVRKVKARIGG